HIAAAAGDGEEREREERSKTKHGDRASLPHGYACFAGASTDRHLTVAARERYARRAMHPPPLTLADLVVPTIGEATRPSPLALSTVPDDEIADFVPDDARVVLDIETTASAAATAPLLFEKAGPRARIFFDPAKMRAAIVTCGGLSPGINNVVRAMVLELYF